MQGPHQQGYSEDGQDGSGKTVLTGHTYLPATDQKLEGSIGIHSMGSFCPLQHFSAWGV